MARMGDEHSTALDLMKVMVATSQHPAGGNLDFVEVVSEYLAAAPVALRRIQDPALPDRALLVVDVGASEGTQSIVAVSHSDVVGVESQIWTTDPWVLNERDGLWFGRGVCDTHGSGVAMLLAALRPDVQGVLADSGRRATIIFTYDEEATEPSLSMRGARLAAGLLDTGAVVESGYFVVGEPTEIGGELVAMRGHKGRWLAQFRIDVARPGHVADIVQNAFMLGADVVEQIGEYARTLRYGTVEHPDERIFDPPHSTIQVSAVNVKNSEILHDTGLGAVYRRHANTATTPRRTRARATRLDHARRD